MTKPQTIDDLHNSLRTFRDECLLPWQYRCDRLHKVAFLLAKYEDQILDLRFDKVGHIIVTFKTKNKHEQWEELYYYIEVFCKYLDLDNPSRFVLWQEGIVLVTEDG